MDARFGPRALARDVLRLSARSFAT